MQQSGTVSAHPTGSLVSTYQPEVTSYDEMVDASGRLRPAWTRFAQSLEALGPARLSQRNQQAQRLFRENGVTYNVYGASRELERPWELDPLPLLFPVADWSRLSAGIEQRARLFNALMADLYGHQRAFQSGLLPAAVLFQNPGFLLPCHGIQPPGGVYLHWYGVQLTRRTDGSWQVVSDRTQGPSGAGYAVENRIVVSRTWPQDFENLHVIRLASMYMSLKETLKALSPRHGDNPRAVLLSPGSKSPRYFEDVYLARYLGYALVEGGDLTVRRDGVFLKSLGGLLPVDMILRRVRDTGCDPLDLRPDAATGVSGLVQAARCGQVLLANTLGSSFLETPALHAFLPGLCRFLLNEDLLLPSSPTWWCGDPQDHKHVEEHFPDLVLRPAFRQRPDQGMEMPHHETPPSLPLDHPERWLHGVHVVSHLSTTERHALWKALCARPEQFVAQEPVQSSTAPVWDGDRLRPWHVTLRTFAVASGRGYRVLPGGMSRVAPRIDMLAESVTAGQRSKDVWVLADGPVERVSLLQSASTTLELKRSTNDLPSRAADHLFWLGRLMERTEALVRHLRSIVVRLTSELQPSGPTEMAVLVAALAEPGHSRLDKWLRALRGDSPIAEAELWSEIRRETRAYLTDATREGSLTQTLRSAQAAAAIVRDRISLDGWRIISQLTFRMEDTDVNDLGQALLPLNRLLAGISAFHGLCSDSMTRGPGWRFLDIGRRIERGLQILDFVSDILVDGRTEILPQLEAMLEIADSSMTYRYRYLTTLQLAPVLDLIIADETNPRSVAFQFATLAEHVRQLSTGRNPEVPNQEQQLVLEAQGGLRLTDVEALCEVGPNKQRQALQAFQKRVSHELMNLSDAIMHTYVTHTTPPQQLGGLPPELLEDEL